LVAALCLYGTGLTIRWLSIFTLGPSFARSLKTSPGQTLVTYGMYRCVRHPSYAGMLACAAGTSMLTCNWIAAALLLGTTGRFLYRRMTKEEEMMRHAFGAEYAAYCARTNRLVPWIY
jgi:protein-S-isoprenylcysteine O-methyltransferase Ste14